VPENSSKISVTDIVTTSDLDLTCPTFMIDLIFNRPEPSHQLYSSAPSSTLCAPMHSSHAMLYHIPNLT